MSRQRRSSLAKAPVIPGRRQILLGALLLGVSFGASSAFAASGHDLATGAHASRSLVSSQATDDDYPAGRRDLDISVVDLSADDKSTFGKATLDELELAREPLSSDADSQAPLLFLGPRVATQVRDVFGDDEADDASRLIDEPTGSAASAPRAEVPMAPLADSSDILKSVSPVIDASVDPATADDSPYSAIRIYREMYRTDI